MRSLCCFVVVALAARLAAQAPPVPQSKEEDPAKHWSQTSNLEVLNERLEGFSSLIQEPRAWTPLGLVLHQEPDRQAALELDWIRLSLTDTSRLLREKLEHATGHARLRAAVDEMLAQKKATRLDYSLVTMPHAERGKLDAIREEPYEADWDVLRNAAGDLVAGAPVRNYRNIGCMVEAQALVLDGGRLVDFSVSAQKSELLGDLLWQGGAIAIRQPVLSDYRFTSQVLAKSGEWNLMNVSRLFAAPAEGLRPGISPPCPDCLLLFARARAHPAPVADDAPQPPAKVPSQCLVIAEHIECEASVAASLVIKFPALTDGEAIRREIDNAIAAGTARLKDTGMLLVRDGFRAKFESICQMSFPDEFSLDTAVNYGRTKALEEKIAAEGPDKKPQTPPPAVPSEEIRAPSIEFSTWNCGGTVEVEATWVESSRRWWIHAAVEEITLDGSEPVFVPGKDALAPAGLRARTTAPVVDFLVAPGRTALVSVIEEKPVPAAGGDPPPGVNPRVTMLFLKVIE